MVLYSKKKLSVNSISSIDNAIQLSYGVKVIACFAFDIQGVHKLSLQFQKFTIVLFFKIFQSVCFIVKGNASSFR